jgi:hypothetical protein
MTCRLLLVIWLVSCTDAGVIGERARSSAGAGGAAGQSAAGAASTEPCLFGVCELPPLCTSPEPFCILCDSDADCVRDPVDRFCSPLTSTCVACLSDNDCRPDAPYCDGGECGVCNEDEQCPEDFKCDDGSCKPD